MNKAQQAFHDKTLGVSLTKNTADRSDEARFLFSFFCDACGKEWQSHPVPFKSGGFTAIEHEYTRQMIWAEEHRQAFENANLEAHFHFSRCPVCGSCVCDECFGADESDRCKACAKTV